MKYELRVPGHSWRSSSCSLAPFPPGAGRREPVRIPAPAASSHAAPSGAGWTTAGRDNPTAAELSPGHAQRLRGKPTLARLRATQPAAMQGDFSSQFLHLGCFLGGESVKCPAPGVQPDAVPCAQADAHHMDPHLLTSSSHSCWACQCCCTGIAQNWDAGATTRRSDNHRDAWSVVQRGSALEPAASGSRAFISAVHVCKEVTGLREMVSVRKGLICPEFWVVNTCVHGCM